MKTFAKRLLSLAICLALVFACVPGTVYAETLSDVAAGATLGEIPEGDIVDKNEGTVTTVNGELSHNYGTVTTHNGVMSYNYGTITTNAGEVIENKAGGVIATNQNEVSFNYGTVTTNESSVYENHGTVSVNKDTVFYNFGTVTDNQGTVEYNLRGTVTGGEVLHNYVYKIDIAAAPDIAFYPDGEDFDSTCRSNTDLYVKEGISVIIEAYQGLQISGTPTVTGGTLTKNDDGSYTLSDITGDITITAATEFLPVSDIVDVPETGYVDGILDLSVATVQPANANSSFTWTVVDAGTTGAAIADPDSGELLATAAGTVTVKASVEDGLAPGVPFEKTFAIEIIDPVPLVIDAYSAVREALKSKDPDKLQPAVDIFYEYVDAFNSLSDDQMEKLADAFNVPSDEIFSEVLGDWITINILAGIAPIRADFLEEANEDTATAYIDIYESITDETMFGGMDKEIDAFFGDFEKLYILAKQTLCKHDGKTVVKGKTDATEKKEGYTGDTHCKLCDKVLTTGKAIPKKAAAEKPEAGNHETGDAGTPALWLALTLISGCALLTLAYTPKKKVL